MFVGDPICFFFFCTVVKPSSSTKSCLFLDVCSDGAASVDPEGPETCPEGAASVFPEGAERVILSMFVVRSKSFTVESSLDDLGGAFLSL